MKIYDFSTCQTFLDYIVDDLKVLTTTSYTKQGEPFAHFSYRNNHSIKLDPVLLNKFYLLEKQMGIYDDVFSRFINVMNKGDYLDWFCKEKDVPRFASILLITPTGGNIEFEKEGVIQLQKGQGLFFCSTNKHRVQKVTTPQTSIIWLLPHYYQVQELS